MEDACHCLRGTGSTPIAILTDDYVVKLQQGAHPKGGEVGRLEASFPALLSVS